MLTLASLDRSAPAQAPDSLQKSPPADSGSLAEARVRREAFGQFVGETFFGQMLKSMRQTVGEPAYFHGGMAEEQFKSRLDAQIAEDLGGADHGLADELFRAQFPAEAELLKEAQSPLAALDDLRRR